MTVLSEAITREARALTLWWPRCVEADPEAIHRARVASRRLREALAWAEAAAPGEDVVRVRKEVRRLTRALGPVRELDVVLAVLEAPAIDDAAWPRDPRAVARRALDVMRAERRDEMRAALATLDSRRLLSQATAIAESLAARPAHAEWLRAARTRVERRARALSRAVDHCGTLYAPERLHNVRLATKKLRYALELAKEARVCALGTAPRILRTAQQQFGRLHDQQVLLAHLQQVRAAAGRAGIARALARLCADVERDCREQHAAMLPRLTQLAQAAEDVVNACQRRHDATSRRMLKAGDAAATQSRRRVARA